MCVCWVLSGGGYYSRGGQRKGRGGHMWPPTCLWPFIKPGGGGRERRANRYWHLVEQGEAHAACWLKQQPSCAASKRSQHADSVRGYANKLVSIAFHIAPAGLVRPCQLTTLSPPTHTAHQEWHVTTPPPPQIHGTCSSIRQDWTNAERLKPNWEWSRTHWECESGRTCRRCSVNIWELHLCYNTGKVS